MIWKFELGKIRDDWWRWLTFGTVGVLPLVAVDALARGRERSTSPGILLSTLPGDLRPTPSGARPGTMTDLWAGDLPPPPEGTRVPPVKREIDAVETLTAEPTHKLDFAARSATVPLAALPHDRAGTFVVEVCLRVTHDRGERWSALTTGPDGKVPWGLWAGRTATFRLRHRWRGRFDADGELTQLEQLHPRGECDGDTWPGAMPYFRAGDVYAGPVAPSLELEVSSGVISVAATLHPLPTQFEEWGGAIAATYQVQASGVVSWVE